jgi:hypothetical protein
MEIKYYVLISHLLIIGICFDLTIFLYFKRAFGSMMISLILFIVLTFIIFKMKREQDLNALRKNCS